MPRSRVVATVALALALALVVAGCDSSPDPAKVSDRQRKLEQVYVDGQKARESMLQFGFTATESECKAHYAATEGNELGSDAMVDLGREYFVNGCRA
jgi:hypothetical protein